MSLELHPRQTISNKIKDAMIKMKRQERMREKKRKRNKKKQEIRKKRKSCKKKKIEKGEEGM